MNTTEDLYNLARKIFVPFFPTSESRKEEILSKIREKVDYYKPRIEDICNLDLGEVFVKDMKYMSRDFIRNMVQNELEEYNREGKKPSKLDKLLIAFPIIPEALLGKPVYSVLHNLWPVEMVYDNSTIYVPFLYNNRKDLDFKVREKILDQAVVHEISHKLWDCLGGSDYSETGKKGRLWNEGFAMYCSNNYFTRLYPKGYALYEAIRGVHKKGKEKVEQVVDRYGNDIVLEIPLNWKELDMIFEYAPQVINLDTDIKRIRKRNTGF